MGTLRAPKPKNRFYPNGTGGLHQLMIVGLTGGIATGKTTVANMLRRAGADIIDADRIAHEVVAPGEPAWNDIQTAFGKAVLRPDHTIDRKLLGAIVFDDADLRRRLEEIVHPRVFSRIEVQVADCQKKNKNALIIQDIPLLMETGAQSRFSEVILVYVPPETQLQRLIQRDRISTSEAQARIEAQMPIDAKRELATIIIDNSGSLAHTEKQVQQVYARLVRRVRS